MVAVPTAGKRATGAARGLALASAVVLCTAATAAPDYADGITGAEAGALVTAALAERGLAGEPAISEARRYPPCAHSPQITPRGGTWSTVDMRCTAPTPWARALRTGIPPDPVAATPVDMTPDGPLMATLTESLGEGAVIEAGHVTLHPAAAATGTGGFGAVEDVIGRRLKVGLSDGQVVLARHLEQAWLIVAGTPVAISFEGGAFEGLAPGEAIEDGQRGDLIDVRNRSTGRVVKGYVVERNKVAVYAKLN